MYNPMIDYKRNELMAQQAMIQQQLAQLNQMTQPMQINQPTVPNVQQTQYFVREINSFDEAKRIVPNFGEIYVLIDSKEGKIYLKQMNPDTGKSDYLFYNVDNSEKQTEKDPIAIINDRLSKIETSIGGLYESISSNETVSKLHEKPSRDNGGQNYPERVSADEASESATVQPDTADIKRKERK